LAILPEDDRQILLDLLIQLADSKVSLAFDTNFRASLWPDIATARTTIAKLTPAMTLVLTTLEDEQRLWGDRSAHEALARLHAAGAGTVIMKRGAASTICSDGEIVFEVSVPHVTNIVDTTAAGDSFNAGFLAGWLTGCALENCCRFGNAIAAAVVQHRGAIIPAAVTPSMAALASLDISSE
jgi:2-dehydro-3-deoxygluconokinase